MRTLLRVLIALVVVVLAAAAGGYAWLEHTAGTPVDPAGAQTPIEVRVPAGAGMSQVGRLLEQQGVIRDARVYKWHAALEARLGGERLDPKAGRHRVHAGMTMPEVRRALAGTPLSDDVPLTMVEGWRIRDADEWLAAQKLIEPGEYTKAAETPSRFQIPFPFNGTTLEGHLYPETYMVPPGKIDVQKLIQRQIDAFAERFWVPHRAEIEQSGRTLYELVTIASMLEREEPVPAQRPEVAGVMYKRLDQKMGLGIDATSRYLLEDWNNRRAFLAKLRDPSDPYNTRLRVGLPPTPIGAPGLESLQAALRPVKTPYLYYLHDADRKIHFSRTAEEHEALRKRYNVY